MTRALRVTRPGVSPDVIARGAQLAQLATVEDVLRFSFAQRPAWELVEVIVQDEFTHDVVVAGPEPAFLVFDTT